MVGCFAPGCPNKQVAHQAQKGFTLHVFPRSPCMIRLWLTATGRHFDNLDDTVQTVIEKRKHSSFRICSDHFAANAYHNVGVSRFLKSDAVPSIFENTQRSKQRQVFPTITQLSPWDATGTSELLSVSSTAQISSLYFNGDTSNSSGVTNSRKRLRFSDHDYTIESMAYAFGNIIDEGTNTDSVTMVDGSCLCKPAYWNRHKKIQTYRYFGKRDKTNPTRDASTQTGDVSDESSVNEEAHSQCETSTAMRKSLFSAFASPISTKIPCASRHGQYESESFFETSKLALNAAAEYPTFKQETEETDISMNQSSGVVEQTVEQIVLDSKFIVFQSCLDQLLQFFTVCSHDGFCGAPIVERTKSVRGTLLVVYATCINNHRTEIWRSQPMIGSKPAGNVLWSAAVLFSGSHFSKAAEMFKILGVPCIENTTHYVNQANYLFPVVDYHHKLQHDAIVEKLKGQSIGVSGDGQCDSRGHCARYCVYGMIEESTKKVIECEVVEATETTAPTAMEKEGFVRCVDRILNNGIDIAILVTDKHVGIRSVVEKKHPDIIHQFDIWHYAKSLNKKLLALCKKRNCKELEPWRNVIVKHFWTSTSSCRGNMDLLIEKWRSILKHITNEHFWSDGTLIHGCDHGLIDEEKQRELPWLDKESFVFGVLSKLVMDKLVLKDLQHMAHFCHTGEIEVFNRKVLKQRTNQHRFTKDGMIARTKLAVLSHNFNVNRPTAKVKKCNKKIGSYGQLRFQTFYSKKGRTWKIKPVHEKSTILHLYRMMVDVGLKLNGEIDF